MSTYNIKLKVWTNATTGETRIYVDGKYVEYRNVLSHANLYLKADENGAIIWNNSFKCNYNTITAAEMNRLAFGELIKALNGWNDNSNISFAELLERVTACQTKGGNFSFRQYEKKYFN